MNIYCAEEINRQEWNRLVLSHPQSRFYQLAEYQDVLKEVFRYKPVNLIFKDGNETIGIFPIYLVKTIFFKKLVSIPFSEYGGIFTNFMDKLDFSLIRACLKELIRKYSVQYLEINAGLGLPQEVMQKEFFCYPFHHYAELELNSQEKLWEGFEYQVRKAVNKAIRSGVECFQQTDTASIKDLFYPLYLRANRRLNSPPLGLNYFLSCYRNLKERMKIFYARHSKKIIAALLGFSTDERVYIQYIVSDERQHERRSVDLVHWEYIKWAIQNRFKFFDFGPVRYEGQSRYKLKWNANLKTYNIFYLFENSNKKCRLPVPITPLSPQIGLFKKAWKMQLPLVQNAIGPWIRWNLAK